MRKALYAFSGDPITNGHIDMVRRACQLFGKVVVGIGTNPDKHYTFSAQTRLQMAEEALQNYPVTVVQITGLTVDYAVEHGIGVLVRGVRNGTDMDYEQTINSVNASQGPIETVFLFADPHLAHISSSVVKALQKESGMISQYVPFSVKQAMDRNAGQLFVGITGGIASGKSKLAKTLVQIGKREDVEVHNIDFDEISHDVLVRSEYMCANLQSQILAKWPQVGVNAKIDRKKLGALVFANGNSMVVLNHMMKNPCMVRFRKLIRRKQGIILVNAAYLSEYGMLDLCNLNVIVTTCSEETQRVRLLERGHSPEQCDRRIRSQFSTETRLAVIHEATRKHGFVWQFPSEEPTNYEDQAYDLFRRLLNHFRL
jgi:pantetheine-phosphate adenylyltransferase